MRQQLITIPLLNVLVQWIKDRLNEKSNTNHTHGSVTTAQDGFMTSADKTKLNGIAANANKTTIVDTLTSTSTTSALSANQGRLLNSSLSGKANAEHEHAEYLSELPLPLTKIGETDGQMTYDGQVVTGGGGGEPAWGEYGQFKKVMIPEHIIGSDGYGDSDAFWDFVRDEYAYKPGMYVFVYKYNPTGDMEPLDFYSADGIMVTHFFDPGTQEWMDIDEIFGSFPINEIPEDLAEWLSDYGGFLWDNFERAGDPIHVWEAPETPEPRETVYEAGTIMWFEGGGASGAVVFHTLMRGSGEVHHSGTEYVYKLTTVGNKYENGQWRRTVGNQTRFYGTPNPGAPVDPER